MPDIKDIKAALIDMDGVLYDSMPFHARSWRQMTEEYGFDTTEEEFYLYEGMTGQAVINKIMQRERGRQATDDEVNEMYARKAELFNANGRKQQMPGAARMLRAFMGAAIPRVLVTGSGQESLLSILNSDYPGVFAPGLRVTAHDVKKGKPDAEPYLMGAERAHVSPKDCIVVENAPLGVMAGKAAGAFTVAVTTGPIPREAFVKAGADMIFDSMDHFADWLEANLPRRDDPALAARIDAAVRALNAPTVTVVTDTTVRDCVFPLLGSCETLKTSEAIVIPPGEDHKSLESVCRIWDALENCGATRRSAVLNIGGGLITDIGGFAAATFKRGIRVVNVPTTLLGAVDAATGGKTGINYNGLKNEIGSFHQPVEVVISAAPLATLPMSELVSGYAEMLKTGFIADAGLYGRLLDMEGVLDDPAKLEECMKRCVEIKEEVVRQDPEEKGLRKILNFGHTAGHAFESHAIETGHPVPHGVAVAHGMLVELILSKMLKGLESSVVSRYAQLLKENYPKLHTTCKGIDRLMELMAHDKKNASAGRPNFTLLESVGEPVIDCVPETKDIATALEIYCDLA